MRPDSEIRQDLAVLALDTSNYTTSAAAADLSGHILADERRLLEVEKGKRGLRQSQAFFQHMNRLPEQIEAVCLTLQKVGIEIAAVAASDRPRPVEGSYMPCFLAGKSTGAAIASALHVPFFTFSHQEGHIAAVAGIRPADAEMIVFHLSGGTGEMVRVLGNHPRDILGGIRDISFGQLLDRIGVAGGLEFPAGKPMDQMALEYREQIRFRFSRTGRRIVENGCLHPIFIDGSEADLSGIETECLRALEKDCPLGMLSAELFFRITDALAALAEAACAGTGIREMHFAGGVASSQFIRQELVPILAKRGIRAEFGEPQLSSDNACGTAILGAAQFQEMAASSL